MSNENVRNKSEANQNQIGLVLANQLSQKNLIDNNEEISNIQANKKKQVEQKQKEAQEHNEVLPEEIINNIKISLTGNKDYDEKVIVDLKRESYRDLTQTIEGVDALMRITEAVNNIPA